MVAGFRQKFADGTPTLFKEKILLSAGYCTGKGEIMTINQWMVKNPGKEPQALKPKLHTLRAGNRWRAGMSIQMATGVRTKQYEQFNKGIPELETCKSVQTISIKVYPDHPLKGKFYDIRIDGGKILQRHEVIQLAFNDGFNSIFQFEDWFNKDFEGQIVHFTDFKYEFS